MHQFLKIGIVYFACTALIAYMTRENALDLFGFIRLTMAAASFRLFHAGAIIMCLALVFDALVRSKPPRQTVIATLSAVIGVLYFHAGFSMFKTSMPYIVPFFADPSLAAFDRFLHFGVDPWVFVHDVAQNVSSEFLALMYLKVWILTVLLLPVVIVAFDHDAVRIRRLLILYVASWVLIGNVLALAGLSGGPVFYDRIVGGETFSDLHAALQPRGEHLLRILLIQDALWRSYTEFGQYNGSGISAFPSVHVSVTTVVAIYTYERWRYLWPVGVAFLLLILFTSVYTGYHYAIDGYVSIIVMVALWLYLRRRDQRELESA